uniref:AlNc14C4G573 protein n=1 Tax=Albugo laibachii Nc14 TaxID=890382 RepID=F0W0D0_9STRA|nr:AlNc14C4G573 [Albugo laibachii Nc14]|eukprot:CCA14502.1 AlNc14C4G573 [Albugo laibachii Nc14]
MLTHEIRNKYQLKTLFVFPPYCRSHTAGKLFLLIGALKESQRCRKRDCNMALRYLTQSSNALIASTFLGFVVCPYAVTGVLNYDILLLDFLFFTHPNR